MGRDLVASAEKASTHLLRAIGHPVPPGAAPLQLAVNLGHTLPREAPRGCYAPPLSSADLVQHYARAGVPMLAVHLRQLDLTPWMSRSGAVVAQPIAQARPEDRALVAALRDWKRPLLLTSEAEDSFEPRTLARAERFAAHTQFAAAVVLETGARYLELPAPDLNAAPTGDHESSLDEVKVLMAEEAAALKRVSPELKIGVTGMSTWTASGHEGDAEFLVHMAAQPWIDWVGAQAYDTALSIADLNRLVVALREKKVDHKLFLFTGTACAPYARPPWKQGEDAAQLRAVGRWAQGRGVGAWIHKPGPTFSTYGWWYAGQRGAGQVTEPLAAFLSFQSRP